MCARGSLRDASRRVGRRRVARGRLQKKILTKRQARKVAADSHGFYSGSSLLWLALEKKRKKGASAAPSHVRQPGSAREGPLILYRKTRWYRSGWYRAV